MPREYTWVHLNWSHYKHLKQKQTNKAVRRGLVVSIPKADARVLCLKAVHRMKIPFLPLVVSMECGNV